MSEEITNEISHGEMKLEDRVENLYKDAFGKIDSLDNMSKKGGFLEMSVKKLGGDISWFNDVRNALDNVYEQIEESQMGAVAHLQMQDESVSEEHKKCGPGEYYCRMDKKCKPIPDGYHVMPDGELMKDGEMKEAEDSGIDKKLVGDLNLILQRSGL